MKRKYKSLLLNQPSNNMSKWKMWRSRRMMIMTGGRCQRVKKAKEIRNRITVSKVIINN